jgi:hypothetical protein
MSIIKKYHDKKWTLQFLDALYNSINYIYIKKLYSRICIHAFPNLTYYRIRIISDTIPASCTRAT